jgi:hypothetical protein
VPFDYDQWVEAGCHQEHLFIERMKVFITRKTEILEVDVPGAYPLLVRADWGTDGVETFLVDFHGQVKGCNGEYKMCMYKYIEMKPVRRYYWIVSYPVVDREPYETMNRRTTKTLYGSREEAEKASKNWQPKDQVQVHMIEVVEPE